MPLTGDHEVCGTKGHRVQPNVLRMHLTTKYYDFYKEATLAMWRSCDQHRVNFDFTTKKNQNGGLANRANLTNTARVSIQN